LTEEKLSRKEISIEIFHIHKKLQLFQEMKQLWIVLSANFVKQNFLTWLFFWLDLAFDRSFELFIYS